MLKGKYPVLVVFVIFNYHSSVTGIGLVTGKTT